MSIRHYLHGARLFRCINLSIRMRLIRLCGIGGCGRKHEARGWCKKHYLRWKSHGDPLKTKRNMEPVTWEYMLSCSAIDEETGCIEWQLHTNYYHYGQVHVNGKHEQTHRVSYRLNVGDIHDGVSVCHHCDNPPCINPDHLFLGTQKDNMRDAGNKGRMQRGEKHHNSKLTRKDVIAIRKNNGTHKQIGKIFCVSGSVISEIKSRKAWRHVA